MIKKILENQTPYDKYGADYHDYRINSKKDFWNRYIDYPAMEKILKEIVGVKKVLDLGCGSGIFTSKIAKWGGEVIGVDESKTMIEIAKKSNNNIKYFVGKGDKLGFENGQFDVVTSNLMVHYYKDLGPLFKEVDRVLKAGGRWIFSFSHPVNEVAAKNYLNGRWNFELNPYFHNKEYHWQMLPGMRIINYHHTFENISAKLNESGLLIEIIIEPRPVGESREVDRRSYEKAMLIPSICIIVSRKI